VRSDSPRRLSCGTDTRARAPAFTPQMAPGGPAAGAMAWAGAMGAWAEAMGAGTAGAEDGVRPAWPLAGMRISSAWQRTAKSSRQASLPGSTPPTTAPLTLRPFQSIPRHPHAIMPTPHAGAGRSVRRRLLAHLTEQAGSARISPGAHRRSDLGLERVVVWTRLVVSVTRGQPTRKQRRGSRICTSG
jgi:hypothetical protein